MEMKTSMQPKGSRGRAESPLDGLLKLKHGNENKYARRGQGGDRKAPLNTHLHSEIGNAASLYSLPQLNRGTETKHARRGQGGDRKAPLVTPQVRIREKHHANHLETRKYAGAEKTDEVRGRPCTLRMHISVVGLECSYFGGFALAPEPLRNAPFRSKLVMRLFYIACPKPAMEKKPSMPPKGSRKKSDEVCERKAPLVTPRVTICEKVPCQSP